MVHPDGKQKGMRTILTERGLYKDGLRKVCPELKYDTVVMTIYKV
ncbi:2206_t:CDS:2 [Entrophospora sp. SA101]|nr:2206_t:CDS:2 [Entrophospora sp. SA101]